MFHDSQFLDFNLGFLLEAITFGFLCPMEGHCVYAFILIDWFLVRIIHVNDMTSQQNFLYTYALYTVEYFFEIIINRK
jgi:hypothetical protein